MAKLCIIIFIFSQFLCLADSPLTSTYFAEAYKKEKIVLHAENQKGKIDQKVIKYLSNDNNAIDVKLACINAISWNVDGNSNAPILLKKFLKKNKCKNIDEFLKKGKASDILCYAYLLSLDDYHHVKEAMYISQIALSKEPNSYAFNIINGLITAQFLFDIDWCEVYKTCDAVREKKQLQDDFSHQAKEIVFEYMDLYYSSCEQ